MIAWILLAICFAWLLFRAYRKEVLLQVLAVMFLALVALLIVASVVWFKLTHPGM